jgi:hypothetical protein
VHVLVCTDKVLQLLTSGGTCSKQKVLVLSVIVAVYTVWCISTSALLLPVCHTHSVYLVEL